MSVDEIFYQHTNEKEARIICKTHFSRAKNISCRAKLIYTKKKISMENKTSICSDESPNFICFFFQDTSRILFKTFF